MLSGKFLDKGDDPNGAQHEARSMLVMLASASYNLAAGALSAAKPPPESSLRSMPQKGDRKVKVYQGFGS